MVTSDAINIPSSSKQAPSGNGADPSTDFKVKELPFYDILGGLLPPTALHCAKTGSKQQQHGFKVSASQLEKIASSSVIVNVPTTQIYKTFNKVQVQLRICAMDPKKGEHDDEYPSELEVLVNGQLVRLPTPIPSNRAGEPPKQPFRPLDITDKIFVSPEKENIVDIRWVGASKRHYVIVNLVKLLTAQELLGRLLKKVEDAEVTRAQIKEMMAKKDDGLCGPVCITLPLACPLGKSRMVFPCKATTCKHIQCFDAKSFLMMNERKCKFNCPVCNNQVKFQDLRINGYFKEVLASGGVAEEINLFPDGSWSQNLTVGKPPEECAQPKEKKLKRSPLKSSDEDDEIEIIEMNERPCTSTSSSKARIGNPLPKINGWRELEVPPAPPAMATPLEPEVIFLD